MAYLSGPGIASPWVTPGIARPASSHQAQPSRGHAEGRKACLFALGTADPRAGRDRVAYRPAPSIFLSVVTTFFIFLSVLTTLEADLSNL